jgi:hypothetical protein
MRSALIKLFLLSDGPPNYHMAESSISGTSYFLPNHSFKPWYCLALVTKMNQEAICGCEAVRMRFFNKNVGSVGSLCGLRNRGGGSWRDMIL